MIGGYGEYSRDKRREDDIAVRGEVSRAAARLRSHLENIHDEAYRQGDRELAKVATGAIQDVDALCDLVDKAHVGGEFPFFAIQKSISKSTIKKLIKHDHGTLDMVRGAVRKSNEAEEAMAGGDNQSAMEMTLSCRRSISSCQGHFTERLSVMRKVKK